VARGTVAMIIFYKSIKVYSNNINQKWVQIGENKLSFGGSNTKYS
jgi:hypothetical protein